MPITAHLIELRRRLVHTVILVFILFCITFNYSEILFNAFLFPMHTHIAVSTHTPYFAFEPNERKDAQIVFLTPSEAFWAHTKLAIIAAFIGAVPLIFYQIWGFVSPGLNAREKRYAIPFIVITTLLFFVGAAFCFMLVLPFAMNFLMTYKTENMLPMISVEKYVDFCLKFVLAFGVIFELPVIIVMVTRMGIVSVDTLARNRKYAILVAFVIAAFLTPTPDAFNQLLMTVPMIVLYEGGILVARMFGKKKEEAKEPPADDKG